MSPEQLAGQPVDEAFGPVQRRAMVMHEALTG